MYWSSLTEGNDGKQYIPLTTIQIKTKYIGYAAVDLLIGKEHRKKEYNQFVMLPTELKIRRSCAPVTSE